MTAPVGLLSVAEIVRAYGVDRARLYLLAHRKGWKRVKWQGRVYYHLADVDRELGRD